MTRVSYAADVPVVRLQVGRIRIDDDLHAGSLAQEVGLGLGAQAGEGRLSAVLKEAGFSRVRRAAETPFNLILEARP